MSLNDCNLLNKLPEVVYNVSILKDHSWCVPQPFVNTNTVILTSELRTHSMYWSLSPTRWK